MFRRRKSTPRIEYKSKKSKKSKKESRKRSGTIKKNKNKNKNKKRSKSKPSRSSSSINPTHCDHLTKSTESSYVIQANLENDILTITVYHTVTSTEWRQQFTQNSFKNNSIHQVAKLLINSIEQTANNQNNENNHKNTTKNIKIFEYNGFCYVTLLHSNLPSFALRPIIQSISNHSNYSISPPPEPATTTLDEPPPLNGIITQNMINKTRKQSYNRRLRYSTGNIVCSKTTNHKNRKMTTYTQQYQQYPVCDNTDKLTITLNGNYLKSTPKQKTKKWSNAANFNSYNHNNYRYQYNNNNNTWSPSQDTVTTFSGSTMDYNNDDNQINNIIIDKGPGHNDDDDTFIDGDYYKHKTMANKDNIKYGFV